MYCGVTTKLKHAGDNTTMNVYQKLQALLNQMVEHFSQVGDWVMDLCSRYGTALVSPLSLGCHCAEIEIDPRQAKVLGGRLIGLFKDLIGRVRLAHQGLTLMSQTQSTTRSPRLLWGLLLLHKGPSIVTGSIAAPQGATMHARRLPIASEFGATLRGG